MKGDVIGDIGYLASTTDGCPPWSVRDAVSGIVKNNFVQEFIPVTIHDLRGKETSVNLDTNAFEILKYNGSIQEEFKENSEEQKTYYEEITDLLKKRLGASRVIIVHFAFRFRTKPLANEEVYSNLRNPIFYPHVDVAPVGVQELLEKAVPKEDMEKVKQNRIQIINIWRPIGPNPITYKPLTICDYCSVDADKDGQVLDIQAPVYGHKSFIMSRNSEDTHIWYYLSEMRSDEMFVFKMFDSKPDVAQFAFHTAFTNKHVPIPDEEQKSIEIRCYVFYDE